MDKWSTAPILGEGFHPIGIPNSGSVDFLVAQPTVTRRRCTRESRGVASAPTASVLRLDELQVADLTREVEVFENGTVTVHDCVFTVLEEEFEHHRYADRDLAVRATHRR